MIILVVIIEPFWGVSFEMGGVSHFATASLVLFVCLSVPGKHSCAGRGFLSFQTVSTPANQGLRRENDDDDDDAC